MKTTFVICPVRGVAISEYEPMIQMLEEEGWKVYWPARDTDQDDPTGYRICQDNLQAIKDADVIHFVWDGKSQGSLFDLGMAFALGKQVIPLVIPPTTEGKSFQNMVMEWRSRTSA